MVTKIYANAVAKYNEGKLLDAEKLRRLADAEFSDAVKMLIEFGYGGGTVDERSYDIDAFISAQISELIDYVLSSSPSEPLARVLTNRFRYGNYKAYYKGKYTGQVRQAALYRMPDEAEADAIASGDYTALPDTLAEALRGLDAEFTDGAPDPKRIDIVLTQCMYADNVSCARAGHSKALRAFVTSEIDLKNVLSGLRARALDMDEGALREVYIEGGKLTYDKIAEIFRAQNVREIMGETPYEFLAEDEEISVPKSEAGVDEYLLRIWEAQAENMQSLSPFVRYFLAQMSEYKTVKTILTCLKNGAKDEILPRLRIAGK